jgi:putative spermidine/putrescine transport system permease protein
MTVTMRRSGDGAGISLTATSLPATALAVRAPAWTTLTRPLATAAVVIGCAAMFLPLGLMIYLSLFADKLVVFPPSGYTLGWYAAIVPQFGGALVTSLELALASVLGSLLVGVPAAIALVRGRVPGRAAFSMLLLLPLTVPSIAIGLGVFIFAVVIEEQTSIPVTGSFCLLVLAHILVTAPWVVRLCVAGLANLDRSAEEAAASLGARPLTVLWRVTLPAIRPGIVAGALFAFIASFENLEMTLFLITPGLTTLPIATFQYLEYRVDPLVAATAVAQVVIIGAALLVLDRLVQVGRVVR